MTYIIRLQLGRKRGTRYGTLRENGSWHVSFGRRLRTRRIRQSAIGPMREMEQVGWDKSLIEMRFGDSVTRDDGMRGLYPGNTYFKLLDRHQHIRRLREGDEESIAVTDRRIEAVQEQLRQLRAARALLVKAAWRRSEKVPIDELEERANAKK